MNPATWAILASSTIALGGCSMCQSPYDYQGPVANSPAAYGPRANSAFAGGAMQPQPMGMAAAPANQQAVANQPTPADNTAGDMLPVAGAQTTPSQRY